MGIEERKKDIKYNKQTTPLDSLPNIEEFRINLTYCKNIYTPILNFLYIISMPNDISMRNNSSQFLLNYRYHKNFALD